MESKNIYHKKVSIKNYFIYFTTEISIIIFYHASATKKKLTVLYFSLSKLTQMNYVLKSFFATLLLTMVLTSSFGKHVIELRLGTDGNLSFQYGDTTKAGFLGKVLWVIADSRIESFQIKDTTTNEVYIFYSALPTVQSTTLEMRVKRWAKTSWYYSIIWVDAATHQPHRYDPIISIKPTDSSVFLIIILAISIVSLPVLLLRRNRIRKKRNIH